MRKIESKDIPTCGEIKKVASGEYAVYEQIFKDDIPQFAYYEQKSGFYKEKGAETIDTESCYIPMQTYPFPKIDHVEDYGSLDNLYDEIYKCVYEHCDLPGSVYYHIATAFIIASWRSEDFRTFTYLDPLGEIESGKTRVLEVLKELSYRGILTSDISTAALVRLLHTYRATVFCDETEKLNHESRFELVQIFNAGYRRDSYYIRVNPDNTGIELWRTWGFKGFAGTSDFTRALNSRCVEIPMQRAERKIRLEIDESWTAQLRCKLLDYRLKNVLKPLPEIELPYRNGRLHEVLGPLIKVVPEQHRPNIIEHGINLERQRDIETVTSFEGDVLRATLKIVEHTKKVGKDRFKANDIFEEFKIISDIDPEILNKQQTSYKNRIGRVLRNKFHLKPNTQKEYFIDTKLIESARQRYTLVELDNSDKSDKSNTNEITDLSYLSDNKEGIVTNTESKELAPPQITDNSDNKE